MTNDIGRVFVTSLNNGLYAVASFLPKFIAGAIILLIGIIVASILKQLILELFKALKIEAFLKKYGIPDAGEDLTWSNILAEIVRWFAVIIFLIPTADVWGLPQIVTVLNTFLLYLPNVFVGAIIALVGLVFARLTHDIVFASSRRVVPESAQTIASVTRWAVTVFVILAVLNQLGVASDLIRILFTGFVAMIAIAGGIAFGLGGQHAARDIVEELQSKIRSEEKQIKRSR